VTGGTATVSWQERIWPAWWLWLAVAGLGLGFGLVVAPFGGVVVVAVAVLATLVLGGLLLASTPTVAVDGDTFVAGRARIPVRLLGAPEVLDAASMRHARGPGLDARAYLCLRGWVPGGVRVPVLDEADPTPYWLVSSRRPSELAEALTGARR
jgi:hypothetical protein